MVGHPALRGIATSFIERNDNIVMAEEHPEPAGSGLQPHSVMGRVSVKVGLWAMAMVLVITRVGSRESLC